MSKEAPPNASAPPMAGDMYPNVPPPPYQPPSYPFNYQQGAPEYPPPVYGQPPPNMQMPIPDTARNAPRVHVNITTAPNVGGRPPMMPSGQTTTVIVEEVKFGPHSQLHRCMNCNNYVQTETYSQSGLLTWLLAGTICLLGCTFGCCLLPFCITECQDVEHRCPSCKKVLGYYRRI